MSIKLPIELYSPDQLGIVMLELHKHISALRDANARARTASAKVGTVAAPSAMLQNIFQATDTAPEGIMACEKLLDSLETMRSSVPVARITLADMPGTDLKQKITTWFRSEIHPDFLLTFIARADIGGGLILQAGAHIYDLSFRKKILDNRQRLGEIYSKGSA